MTQPSKKQQPISRRTFLKRSSWTTIGFLATCAVPFYSYFAEPRWVETNQLELSFLRLPAAFDGVRILQFSDLHYGFFYEPTNLIKLISTINALEPNMIVFTGDFFDGEVVPYVQECIEAFTSLNAVSLGLYAVMGNHDYYTGYNRSAQVIDVYEKSGFKVLRNENITVKRDGKSIQIAGVDDMFLGKPNLERTFLKTDPNMFTLFLAHEPEFADQAIDYPFDLQLSGHSHGGQIRLPLVGAVITPPGGKKYVHGLHTLNNPVGTRKIIYTNRG
ncbi:MAG: metallophosphoesterase, partial [Bacilli bacterium]